MNSDDGAEPDGIETTTLHMSLIRQAASLLKPHEVGGRLFADVGSTLVTAAGNIYLGVSADTATWGLCAERSAMAAMITAGEYRIDAIVAVWKDPASGRLHVLPPCGHCRQFMLALHADNLKTRIILGPHKAMSLAKLLPFHRWPEPLQEPLER